MAHVKDHLSVEELLSAWRLTGDATAARHYQTIWHWSVANVLVNRECYY